MIPMKIISSSLAFCSSDSFLSVGTSFVVALPVKRQECRTMLFSTLNDDGDFIIGGLNDNESNSNYSEDESSSTLLNVAETQNQLASLLTIDYTASTNSGNISDNEEQQNLKSFDFINESVKMNNDTYTLPIQEANRQVDEIQLSKIQAFLTSILTLTESDLKYYAIEFVSIGFDPDCNSSGELEYDDLGFMKQLHRRYFWKEWEKLCFCK